MDHAQSAEVQPVNRLIDGRKQRWNGIRGTAGAPWDFFNVGRWVRHIADVAGTSFANGSRPSSTPSSSNGSNVLHDNGEGTKPPVAKL